MAQHAVLAADHGDQLSSPPLRLPQDPRAAWMLGGLLVVESPEATPSASGPLELFVGGLRVMPSVVKLDLAESQMILAFATAACADGAAIEWRCGPTSTRQAILGAPGGLSTLLRDRPDVAALALLRRLLAVAPAFRAHTDPRFAVPCHDLAAALSEGRPPARALAGGAAGDAVSVWRLPEGTAAGSWRLLEPGAPLRLLDAPTPGQPLILLNGLPGPDAVLIPPEGLPIRFAAPPANLPGLLALARQGGAPRRALLDLLATRPAYAALLRDLQLLAPLRSTRSESPALPVSVALELALPDGEGGLFLRGWLRDPLGLVREIRLRGPGGAVRVPPEALHRLPRPDLAERLRRAPQGDGGPRPGFVAHLPEAGLAPGLVQVTMELLLGSGQRLALTAPPGLLAPEVARDLVLAAVDPTCATPALVGACIAPAVARLQRAAMAAGTGPERIELGRPAPKRPVASLVIPLWRNLGFLRAQMAAFARDAGFRGANAPLLVYVLDSPDQREAATALLRGLALLHDLPVTLLLHDRNRGYASACNSGAAVATAPLLAFLNSDVVPQAPGWLEALRRRLSGHPRLAAVGPKLVYPDGAIQHAGLFFAPTGEGGWGTNHYFKGWPARHPPACRARQVPAVTGAALVVRRAAFEAVSGFCTDYVLGDFEDSDLCLKLRAAGHGIGYEPAAELVHHERQSIALHPGHAGTLAAACNRHLHDARWGPAIAALMRRHPHPVD
ncbi:glycosyltransferase [Falsiroseomonas sp. E2-1-a20]|uniref:glycosyltransferase n=1 Tax=Falsiroseomonas sp. E2-1-a20 TaxID=3239300 RepID=UPI003F361DA1